MLSCLKLVKEKLIISYYYLEIISVYKLTRKLVSDLNKKLTLKSRNLSGSA